MSPRIAERLENCLHRQIAAFEQAREELAVLGEGEDIATDEVLAAQEGHLKLTTQLEEELQLLLPEWQAAYPPPAPEERARIAELAGQAQSLADELQTLYEAGQARARAAAARLQGERGALRSQRGALRYHPNPNDDPQRVDRKA